MKKYVIEFGAALAKDNYGTISHLVKFREVPVKGLRTFTFSTEEEAREFIINSKDTIECRRKISHWLISIMSGIEWTLNQPEKSNSDQGIEWVSAVRIREV